ncbi:MAG: PIN domain-containing protein [Smithella sp.]
MNDSVFIDTNILVYAATTDHQEMEKREMAVALLNDLNNRDVYVSTQVINEFYSILLKNHIDEPSIREKIGIILREMKLVIVRLPTIDLCWQLRDRYRYSYWDSMILATACEKGCAIIYTEDMQHQQLIEDKLRIVNPFA